MPHPMLSRILNAMAGGGIVLTAGCIADPQGLEDAEVPLPDGAVRFSEDAAFPDMNVMRPPPPTPDAEVTPPPITPDLGVMPPPPDAEVSPPDAAPPIEYVCQADWAECFDPGPGEPCPDLETGDYETMVGVLEALGYQDDGCLWAYGPCDPEGLPARCCYTVDFGCEGRPFIVEAQMLTASPISRGDWV